VSELLAPLRLRSGATTVTSASGRRASAQPLQAFRPIAVVVADQYAQVDRYPASFGRLIYWTRRSRVMSDRRSDGTNDEFRAAVTGVRPLPPRDRAAADAPKPPPVARFKHADEASVLDESLHGPLDPASIETGEELVFRQPGVQPGVIRKLRTGTTPSRRSWTCTA
jgi:hypothetical protein